MTCWAVIPVKAVDSAKSRLAEALDSEERLTLVRSMLEHVVTAAQGARAISRVLLVGPSRLGLPETIPLLADPGRGLNAAIESARTQIMDGAETPPDRLLILFADLPEVTSAEIDLLASAPDQAIALAPDRHALGTNALSLPLPAAAGFRFAFGEDSLARHKSEAQRIGLEIEVIVGKGLERDVDEPDDLPGAQAARDAK